MSLNITIFSRIQLRNGAMGSAPLLDANAAGQVVALGAASTVINGPAMLRLLPDEDTRITASKAAGYVAPAATDLKLKAGLAHFFELPAGAWYINAVAG